jgi:galactoside O-acetyltransferase
MRVSQPQTDFPARDRVLELARETEESGRPEEAGRLRAMIVGQFGRRLARPAVEALAQWPRIQKYRVLSTCRRISGEPRVLQPVLFVGPGEISLGEEVQFGWKASPLFYTGYCHVEVSRELSRVEIGDHTEFNNNLMIKCDGAGIRIGRDGLFGAHVEILDSDFHNLEPANRKHGQPKTAPVEIGDNVFAGMGVRILKGATIESNSVIGAGAVVTGRIPAGVIAAGNPARVIREL